MLVEVLLATIVVLLITLIYLQTAGHLGVIVTPPEDLSGAQAGPREDRSGAPEGPQLQSSETLRSSESSASSPLIIASSRNLEDDLNPHHPHHQRQPFPQQQENEEQNEEEQHQAQHPHCPQQMPTPLPRPEPPPLPPPQSSTPPPLQLTPSPQPAPPPLQPSTLPPLQLTPPLPPPPPLQSSTPPPLQLTPALQSSTQTLQSPPCSLPITFQKDHTNMFRLLIAMDQIARPVMNVIFIHGAPSKNRSDTLKDYLINSKGVTNTQYRKTFNRTSREKIESDPSCDSFDVSLWLPAIQLGCDNLAAPDDNNAWHDSPHTLENHLKRIKDFRNIIMHSDLAVADEDFYDKLEMLRELLVETVELGKAKYNIDSCHIDPFIIELNEQITQIRNKPLTPQELKDYTNIPLFRELQRILETRGTEDLIGLFKKLSNVNPASLIAGLNIQIKVDLVFTSLEIKEAGRSQTQQTIDHTNFLQYAHTLKRSGGNSEGQVILVEGVAGSGKTTFLKMLLSDFTSGKATGNFSVKEMDQYKFLIPVECRNRSSLSITNLISSLMPSARKHFQTEQHMADCLLDLPTLITVDGLDEINHASKQLFTEILQLKSIDNVTVICTTRPEKVQEYYRMAPSDVSTLHIKIKGIPENLLTSFVFKYHEELKSRGFSKQETKGLINYFKTTGSQLRDHWKLPLNLTLLCLLWAVDSKRVNYIATPIELLYQIHELTVEKLLERLDKCEAISGISAPELKKRVNIFLSALSHEALLGLRDDTLLLQEETVHHLTSVCKSLNIPPEQALGAFLLQKNSWSPTGMVAQVTFTHKSMQEFYSSRYIYSELIGQDMTLHTDDILRIIMDALSNNNVPPRIIEEVIVSISDTLTKCSQRVSTNRITVSDILNRIQEGASTSNLALEKYQNTLLTLLGYLYLEGKNADETLAKELIELLEVAGVNDCDTWLSCLKSIRCEASVAKLISKMPGMLDGDMNITSTNIHAYNILLRDNRPRNVVKIDMRQNISESPSTSELLQSIAKHQCSVLKFNMDYLFRNPLEVGNPLLDNIKQVMDMCAVEGFIGQLSPSMTIPAMVTKLRVSIPNTGSYKCLQHFLSSENRLQQFSLCVSLSVQSDVITPIPGDLDYTTRLYLPDVETDEDASRALDIAAKLNPTRGKKSLEDLYFPRCKLTPEGIERLFVRMRGVKVSDAILFPTSCKPLDEEVERRLQTKAVKSTKTRDGIVWGKFPNWESWMMGCLDSWEDIKEDSLMTDVIFSSLSVDDNDVLSEEQDSTEAQS